MIDKMVMQTDIQMMKAEEEKVKEMRECNVYVMAFCE